MTLTQWFTLKPRETVIYNEKARIPEANTRENGKVEQLLRYLFFFDLILKGATPYSAQTMYVCSWSKKIKREFLLQFEQVLAQYVTVPTILCLHSDLCPCPNTLQTTRLCLQDIKRTELCMGQGFVQICLSKTSGFWMIFTSWPPSIT